LVPRLTLALVLSVLVVAAATKQDAAAPPAPAQKWFRGNTHCHTFLCGHADSTPEAVAQWYLDHGYHFLCLSEHNRFIDPAAVQLPPNRRKDFILVPGEEITGTKVHMTALNTRGLVIPTEHPRNTFTMQAYTDRTRAAGGVPVINHPNFGWALTDADIRPVKRCRLFELYNGHPAVNNAGDAQHPSTEHIWDALLTDGMVMYGASSDDAHEFATHRPDLSNPGRGWVMVRAAELTPAAIADAMERGDFYASSGVILKDVRVDEREYRVVVDRAATEAEAAKPDLIPHVLPQGTAGKAGYRIDFIGPGGKILHSVAGAEATFRRQKGLGYVRAKVTFTRRSNDQWLQHHAWTQPAFGDGRRGA
jgi:hypothetical protein